MSTTTRGAALSPPVATTSVWGWLVMLLFLLLFGGIGFGIWVFGALNQEARTEERRAAVAAGRAARE